MSAGAVISKTGNLRQCGRTYHRLAVELAVRRILELDILDRALAADHFRRRHDCVYNLLVTGTATYITGLLEPVANFFTGRVRILLQQCVSGYDKSGNAESALYGSQMHPGVLKRMRIQHSTDAFNRCNGAVLLYILDFSGAGTDYFSIQDNGARSAYAGAASYFCAGQAQAAQYGRQRILFRIADKHAIRSIDV